MYRQTMSIHVHSALYRIKPKQFQRVSQSVGISISQIVFDSPSGNYSLLGLWKVELFKFS